MSHKYLIEKCDKLCFQILLLRDKKCQKSDITDETLVQSHCFGKKAYPNLRHDLQNLLLLTTDSHNNYWHRFPVAAWGWFIGKFPRRYEYLMVAKNKTIKLNKEHYQDTAKALEAELKKLEGE